MIWKIGKRGAFNFHLIADCQAILAASLQQDAKKFHKMKYLLLVTWLKNMGLVAKLKSLFWQA